MSALTDLFTSLANKIRSKLGTTSTYTPAQAISAIDDVYNKGVADGTTPTQEKTATAETSAITVTPDSGYALSKVTVNPQSHSGTYTFPANDTGGTKDLGQLHSYRYVNASNVYNAGVSGILSSLRMKGYAFKPPRSVVSVGGDLSFERINVNYYITCPMANGFVIVINDSDDDGHFSDIIFKYGSSYTLLSRDNTTSSYSGFYISSCSSSSIVLAMNSTSTGATYNKNLSFYSYH